MRKHFTPRDEEARSGNWNYYNLEMKKRACREPAREIPPMTRSCGETWQARRVRSRGVLCLSTCPETKTCLLTVCYSALF